MMLGSPGMKQTFLDVSGALVALERLKNRPKDIVSGRYKTIVLLVAQGIGKWHSACNTGGITLTRLPGVAAEEGKTGQEGSMSSSFPVFR
eukprot:8113325-Ditylum_brightwellii.AAC.1